MTNLSSFGGGVKSIQTGFLNLPDWTGYGSGEDNAYYNVTLTAVDNTKCVVILDMVATNYYGPLSNPSTVNFSWLVTGRMTSTTNLRIGCMRGSSSYKPLGRYQVVEYY